MVEILKDSMMADSKLFYQIQRAAPGYLGMDENTITHIVRKGIEIKAKLSRDGVENGRILQSIYGHTFGYALVSYFDFRKYAHPEAIAIGMIMEGALSHYLGHLSEKDRVKQKEVIERYGFETRIKKPINKAHFINEIRKDKRSGKDYALFALPAKIGKPIDPKNYLIKLSYNELSKFLTWYSNDQNDIQFD